LIGSSRALYTKWSQENFLANLKKVNGKKLKNKSWNMKINGRPFVMTYITGRKDKLTAASSKRHIVYKHFYFFIFLDEPEKKALQIIELSPSGS